MKKWIIIGLVVVIVVVAGLYMLRIRAKSASPEQGFDFVEGDLKIHVFYNRPFKRDRDIFSENGLVPFGKVWRTGANEATYIETNKTLVIKGQELKPGKYSIWTIPGPQNWQVVFNSTYPSWGINFDGIANRNPETDVVVVDVPVVTQDNVVEQFTITLERVDEEIELTFFWDKTLVAVPIVVQ